jgi:hypothetical protein
MSQSSMMHMRQNLRHPTFTYPFGPKVISKLDPDYNQLHPFFGWINPDSIKKIFEHTTQYARLHAVTFLKKTFKSLIQP